MRFGRGADVVRMWFGCGSGVGRMWFGLVFGSGADSLAEVKGKWFPALRAPSRMARKRIGKKTAGWTGAMTSAQMVWACAGIVEFVTENSAKEASTLQQWASHLLTPNSLQKLIILFWFVLKRKRKKSEQIGTNWNKSGYSRKQENKDRKSEQIGRRQGSDALLPTPNGAPTNTKIGLGKADGQKALYATFVQWDPGHAKYQCDMISDILMRTT